MQSAIIWPVTRPLSDARLRDSSLPTPAHKYQLLPGFERGDQVAVIIEDRKRRDSAVRTKLAPIRGRGTVWNLLKTVEATLQERVNGNSRASGSKRYADQLDIRTVFDGRLSRNAGGVWVYGITQVPWKKASSK